MGFGGFGQQGQGFGRGLGDGQGQGERPEEKTDVRFHDSKVQANIDKGKMVMKGFLQGPNKPGEALENIKQAMESGECQRRESAEKRAAYACPARAGTAVLRLDARR